MRKVILFFLGLLVCPILAEAGGLATELGEVVIENLEIGKSYNLTEIADLPMVVINTGDSKIDLGIEPQIPAKAKEGYEPIPELGWIRLSTNTFTLKPQGRAVTDIIISIPEGKEHCGKRYEVGIWSHSGAGGGMIALGLYSRILFTIAKPPTIEPKEERRGMGFTLLPYSVKIDGVKAGRVKEVKEKLLIENLSDKEHAYSIETLSVKESLISLEEGWLDCPNPSFVILSCRNFTLAAEEKKEIKMWIAFPESSEYQKKDYMLVILARTTDKPLGLYSRVYISTK